MFSHERLKVYDKTLACVTTLVKYSWAWDKRHSVVDHALPAGAELSSRLHRQVDKAGTNIILNIAERNGRYPEGECRSFLDIAEASAVNAAAYLNLCVYKAELEPDQRECGIQLLGRIALMLRGLSLS